MNPFKKKTSFEELAHQGVAVKRELDALFDENGYARLNAPAFCEAAKQKAGTTDQRLADLEKLLVDLALTDVAGFVRNVAREYSRPPGKHGFYAIPVSKVTRMPGWSSDVAVQLQGVNYTPMEVLALGALIAAREHPETFGQVSDWPAFEAKEKALQEQLARLYEQIADALTQNDTLLREIRGPFARVTLKMAPEVDAYPPKGLGERVVNWLLAQEHRTEAA